MKKIVSFLALVAFALVLTGCGNTLTCTKNDETYKITYKGDKATKIVMSAKYDSVEDAKDDEEYLKTYVARDGVKVSRNGKKITVTVSGSAAEDMVNLNKADAKKELEDEGYKCK